MVLSLVGYCDHLTAGLLNQRVVDVCHEFYEETRQP